MYRIVCISGDAASGKTTAARKLRDRLPGWQIESTGARFREFCAARGIDPQEISGLDDDFHRAADEAMRSVLVSGARIIAEARLVGWLAREMPDALRVFCDCPLEVRARRFQERESGMTASEALRRVKERDEADTAKFLRLYGIDYHDPSYYTLRVDTHLLTPDEVADRILAAFQEG